MDALPCEIIEYILLDPGLSFRDIINFSSTCSKYREMVNSSTTVWRYKYLQCWPKTKVNTEGIDWYKAFTRRKSFELKALKLLERLAAKFFHADLEDIPQEELSEIEHSLFDGVFYLRHLLTEISSLPLRQSLTHKYYGNILLKFINKKHCREVWSDLLKLSIQEQILEKGAIFISLWCQENAQGVEGKVTSDLDDIAGLVKQHLLQQYKEHPLKNVPAETLSIWKRQNIPGNMFEPDDCKAILWSMNYVLFEELKYWVRDDLKDLGWRKCGIDYAIMARTTTPLIFAVIYESVARRLGVKIEVLDFQGHCLLKWRECYIEGDSPSHYINMDSNELFIKSRCPRKCISSVAIAPCNMQQVAERAALYIYPRHQGEIHLSLRDALELLLVIKPYSLGCYLELARLYILREMDSRDLITKLLDIKNQMSEVEWRSFQPLLRSLEVYQLSWEQNFNNKTPAPQARGPEVEFAVGMIVRDKLCSLAMNRTGVIYGWDIVQEGGRGNRKNGSQVFYKVLGDDGRRHCVAQENLQILHSPPFISHPSIGRFFDEYCTTYYKPNKQLLAEYPEDMEALQWILKKDRKT